MAPWEVSFQARSLFEAQVPFVFDFLSFVPEVHEHLGHGMRADFGPFTI